MIHKIVVDMDNKSILLDGVEVAKETHSFSYGFTAGQGSFFKLDRYMIMNGEPVGDDTGIITFSAVYLEPQVEIKSSGAKPKILLAEKGKRN